MTQTQHNEETDQNIGNQKHAHQDIWAWGAKVGAHMVRKDAHDKRTM